jgi:tetratricopeptide (TPR) repeat protein
MYGLSKVEVGRARPLLVWWFGAALAVLLFLPAEGSGQGGFGDRSGLGGTGGSNTIQGRIYTPSNRPFEARLRVFLESVNASTMSTFTDSDGVFRFSNLEAGQYNVTVEVSSEYEPVKERVDIDRQFNPRSVVIARNINLPIYLRLKATEATPRAGVIDVAISAAPKPAQDSYFAGRKAADLGQVDKAIELFEAAVAAYPTFAAALNELGVLYMRQGKVDKAVEALKGAIQYAPGDSTVQLNYGIALLNKREYAVAEGYLRESLKRTGGVATAHYYLGLVLVNLNRFDEALKELEAAVGLPGGDRLAVAHRYLGGIYWRQGAYKRAAEELEKYLHLQPGAADAERTREAIKQLRGRS